MFLPIILHLRATMNPPDASQHLLKLSDLTGPSFTSSPLSGVVYRSLSNSFALS